MLIDVLWKAFQPVYKDQISKYHQPFMVVCEYFSLFSQEILVVLVGWGFLLLLLVFFFVVFFFLLPQMRKSINGCSVFAKR